MAKQSVLDVGVYQCKQCGERHNEERRMWCYYCSQRICPKCKIEGVDPVTSDKVEVCTKHADRLQEIQDAFKRGGGES